MCAQVLIALFHSSITLCHKCFALREFLHSFLWHAAI